MNMLTELVKKGEKIMQHIGTNMDQYQENPEENMKCGHSNGEN